MHEVLVKRLGGLSLPRKSVVRLTDRPDMTSDFTVDVKQQQQQLTTEKSGLCEICHAVIIKKGTSHVYSDSKEGIKNTGRAFATSTWVHQSR